MRRFATAPGEQAPGDYSTYDRDFSAEGRRRAHAFSSVLGYSRRQHLHVVAAEDFARTVREPIRAFEHPGGGAATCLDDDRKVVVSGSDGDDPVDNPRPLARAAPDGFRPVACRPRRPQTKGKVERPFGSVESGALGGRTFRRLEHRNETAAGRRAGGADIRIPSQTKARPIDRQAEEHPHLIALPARPFDAAEVVDRTVDAEGFVVDRQHFDAVPGRRIGQSVAVRVTEAEVVIDDQAVVEAARHRLFPRAAAAQRSHCNDHDPPRDAPRRSEPPAGPFAARGAAGIRFLEGLLASHRFGTNQAERVLAPAAASPRGDALSAPERAVRSGALSLQAVQRLLAGRGRPKAPRDALTEDPRSAIDRRPDGDPTPPRPPSDSQALPGASPPDDEAIPPETPGDPPAEPEGPEAQDGGPLQPPW